MSSKVSELEARLAALHRTTEAGFLERADELCAAAEQLSRGEESGREAIRRLSHKLRGVAGSAGHEALGVRAGRLEEAANNPTIATLAVIEGARRLAKAARLASTGASAPRTSDNVPVHVRSRQGHALGWRVVALDDERSTRRLLEITFKTAGGCDAEVFDDPAAAMRSVQERPPDLVVVDAMMPVVNGADFYRGVRRRCGDEIPIVILSAASAEELGWDLPVDPRLRWMRKPFRPARLLGDLRVFLAGEAPG